MQTQLAIARLLNGAGAAVPIVTSVIFLVAATVFIVTLFLFMLSLLGRRSKVEWPTMVAMIALLAAIVAVNQYELPGNAKIHDYVSSLQTIATSVARAQTVINAPDGANKQIVSPLFVSNARLRDNKQELNEYFNLLAAIKLTDLPDQQSVQTLVFTKIGLRDVISLADDASGDGSTDVSEAAKVLTRARADLDQISKRDAMLIPGPVAIGSHP